jgi:Transposase DDE domain/Domain of unknown function (DUF4372)
MNRGKTIFSQLMSFLPQRQFQRYVLRYEGNKNIRTFSCWDQFLCMAFAQLSYRESLRDIEACLRAVGVKLFHLGIRGKVSRSTLADANDSRDWRIFADFGQLVIQQARSLVSGDDFALELENAVYALDATVIDVCLSLLPWTKYREGDVRGGMKIHTLLDIRRNIPSFIDITARKVYELEVLDSLVLEPGAFYVMDRGYFDWARLYRIHTSQAFFVIRAKKDVALIRCSSLHVTPDVDVKSDHIVRARGNRKGAYRRYPSRLRRVRFYDAETKRTFIFLTNNFDLPAQTIAALYKSRWQIELFFKWLKQHLRIKAFYGYSQNAVRTQIWVAVTVYVLVAIAKQRLNLPRSLYEILQVLSVTLFEKMPILSAFAATSHSSDSEASAKQLPLL